MKHKLIVTSALLSLISSSAIAGVTYQDGDKYLKLGGRIQLQYHSTEADNVTKDDVFFRRLRPYIEGSIHPQWQGKFQWDMGGANGDNEISIKDAYMQYSGYKNIKVSVGNYLFPFSREVLTSSKYQQLVERTFVGDHNYGTPDRQVGIYVAGHNDSKRWDWALGLADGRIDPDDDKIDFDTAVNDNADWNEGKMIGGRISFHPFGALKLKQGDFSGKQKATISLGAYRWKNDNDNNTYNNTYFDKTKSTDTSGGKTPDVDKVTGIEFSAAYRKSGFSIDAQYNFFNAETIDNTVTSGIYKNGETKMTNYSIEGGYMIIPSQLELVVSMSSQDTDGYAQTWDRTEVGVNWFVHQHDIKFQLTFRQNENIKGKKDKDKDELFIQAQYVF